MLDVKCQMSNVQCPTSNVKRQTFNFLLMLVFFLLMLNVECKMFLYNVNVFEKGYFLKMFLFLFL